MCEGVQPTLGHSSQTGAASQGLRVATVEQDVGLVLMCVMLEVAGLFVLREYVRVVAIMR